MLYEKLLTFLKTNGSWGQEKEAVALLELAKKYDNLFTSARFLASLGTPIKSSRDFQRSLKRALDDVQADLLLILAPDAVSYNTSMTEEERKKAIEFAKQVAIRPIWLSFNEDE